MRFDVIIVGTGQAGVPLARKYADAGRRTAIIERAELGGTCINRGCTPTKTMVASARAAHVARNAGRLGVRTADVKVDLAAVVARKNDIVRQWQKGVQERIANGGDKLTLVRGHGRFTGPREISVNGTTYSAETIVINTGARPLIPHIPGLDEVEWLDSTSIMEVTELPDHLLVLGGGYIGCEFGQMFRRFGADVTIVNRGPHLLDREDEDVSEAIEEVFRKEGITLHTNREVKRIERDGKHIVAVLDDDSRITGSHLLVAVGRTANTNDLGCEAAGIDLDKRGFIKADDHYRTSVEGVYAVGDVSGGPQFTHSSWDDHRILYDLLENGGKRKRSDRLIPYCVFVDPQVARVGISEREAKEKGIDFEIATMPFAYIARAIEVDETAGILKLLIDPKTERILGAAIVGIEAGELIHVFVALMQARATPRAIIDAEAIHPTLAEGLQSLAMSLKRYGG